MICGVAQLIAGPVPTIPAIALGHAARRQIRRTGEDGSGLAIWGLALGYAGLALIVIAIIAGTLLIVATAHRVNQQLPIPPGAGG